VWSKVARAALRGCPAGARGRRRADFSGAQHAHLAIDDDTYRVLVQPFDRAELSASGGRQA
jgi:hypothetical protein